MPGEINQKLVKWKIVIRVEWNDVQNRVEPVGVGR